MEKTLQSLAERCQAGKDEALREELIRACQPLCARIARRFANRGVEEEDLRQVALLSCLRALERYAPASGVPFAAFAARCAAGAVRNCLRDLGSAVRIPRTAYEDAGRLTRARRELSLSLDREPTAQELSTRLGWPLPRVVETLVRLQGVSSLDEKMAGERTLSDILEEKDAFAALEQRSDLESALNHLSPRDRALIQARFMDNLSQREVARRFDMTQMQVHRAEKRALLLLRERLGC